MDVRSTPKVLVADDNAVDRKVLSAIVGRAGFDVIAAVDGNDAIEKFHSEQPDLVLLDALMPGKDGFEVAQEIKSGGTDNFVPIIFLTSLTEAKELARCLEAGGDDFLSKPYNRVILQAKLNAMQRMRSMHRTLQDQRDEISKHHMQLVADQEAAKAVFDNIAHSRHLNANYIRHLLSPLAIFNGDVLLAAQNPANNVYVMLGDFTGHGLAAAVGALPLSDVFYGMTQKGFSLGEIVRQCNRKLCSVLPSGYFCCAAAIYLDFNRQTMEIWNGGLPSVYLRKAGGEMYPIESAHLPLGILTPDRFSEETQIFEVNTSDRLILATDGVIEARDAQGEYFGSDRLEDIIRTSKIDEMFDEVKGAVYSFMQEDDRDDDITLVELEVVDPDSVVPQEFAASNETGPSDWKLTYELGPQSLKAFNPLPLLQQVLMEAPYLRKKSTAIYTVLAELYSNALEHGVLGLDSSLKASAEGFGHYYTARARALESVDGWVRFNFVVPAQSETQILLITVEDSGKGFDYQAYLKKVQAAKAETAPTNKGYHGRGVRLLWDLCEEVKYAHPGNRVQVKMTWETEGE
ncbi:MAG: SpoIIE family protein phosphatase [Pseudomonadota bacterium]